jgi:hypothetical protein
VKDQLLRLNTLIVGSWAEFSGWIPPDIANIQSNDLRLRTPSASQITRTQLTGVAVQAAFGSHGCISHIHRRRTPKDRGVSTHSSGERSETNGCTCLRRARYNQEFGSSV